MSKRSKWSRALAVLLAMVMILTNSSVTTFADVIGNVTEPGKEEVKEEASLTNSVEQEVFAEEDGSLSVKYTIGVTNASADADAEGVSVKAALGQKSSYYSKETETAGLNLIEDVNAISEGLDLNELGAEELAAYTSAVIWKDQTVAAGASASYVFYAHVGEEVKSEADLSAAFFVNGEAVEGTWVNAELLGPKDRTFTYEDDAVMITVDVPAEVTLPEKAELVVKPLSEKSKKFKKAAKAAESAVEEPVVKQVSYDISFKVDGKEVEPEGGEVKVAFKFKEAIFKEEAKALKESEIKVMHIDDANNADDVTDKVKTNKNGALKSVGFTTDSFSVYNIVLLDAQDHTTDLTFITDRFGASYTMEYILANYSVFVEGDFSGQHVVGPVVIGNLVTSSGLGGSVKWGEWNVPQKVPSYVKAGTIPGGQVITCTPGLPFYKGTAAEPDAVKLIGDLSTGVPLEEYTDYYTTDNYVDFDAAMAAISAQAAGLEGPTHITADMIAAGKTGRYTINDHSWIQDGVLNMTLGNSYDIDTFDGITEIHFMGDAEDAVNTIITNKNAPMETVTIPSSSFDKAPDVNAETTSGAGIIYVFPNASTVNAGLSGADHCVGHIVAPSASVNISSGNWNGCVISGSLDTKAEMHMWPYNAGTITTGEAEFKLMKTVDGNVPGADKEFQFVMDKVGGPNGDLGTNQGESSIMVEGVSLADGRIVFAPVTGYCVAGPYAYKIYETSRDPQYEANTTVFYAKVVVTETIDGDRTIYTASEPVYYHSYNEETGEFSDEVQGVATFDNVTAKGSLKITKAAAEGTDLNGKTFSFIVTDAAGNKVSNPDNADGYWTITMPGQPEVTITNLLPGNYTVTEVQGDGFNYVVTSNPENGTVTVTPAGTASVTVTNKEKVKANAQIKVAKTYEKKADRKFRFTLTALGDAPMPEGSENGVKIIDVSQNDGAKSFGNIVYPGVGAYYYELTETHAGEKINGIVYTTKAYDILVVVAERADGTGTEAKVSYKEKGTDTWIELNDNVFTGEFTNTYEANGSIILAGKKTLIGKNMEAEDFHFEVKEGNNVVATGTNDANGNITFTPIAYTAAGTHTYVISEVNGGSTIGNITYGSQRYEVTVIVTDDDNGGFTYTVTGAVFDAVSGAYKIPESGFVNTYDTKKSIAVSASKSLTGRNLKPGEFQFGIYDLTNALITSGTNDADGNITFEDEIEITLDDMKKKDGTGYETEKIFNYTVKEIAGIFPDNVTGNIVTRNLQIKAQYDMDSGVITLTILTAANDLVFTNTYTTQKSIIIEGTKTLTGKDLIGNDFSFQIFKNFGDQAQVTTGTNDKDGKITFTDPITIHLEDMKDTDGNIVSPKNFEYTVKEVNGGTTAGGVTYDGSEKRLVITATYNADSGEITLVQNEEGDAISFTNSYTTSDEVVLSGTKTLNGRDMKDGEFTFTVLDKDGNSVAAGSADASGVISFEPALSYDLSDLDDGNGGYETKFFTYTVHEDNNGADGVSYSKEVKTVTVQVTYNKATGEMEATLAAGSDVIEFTNTYDTKDEIAITGTKNLTGREQIKDEFTFYIKDGQNKIVATGHNAADGTITFDNKIVITLEQLLMGDNKTYETPKDFYYTVVEEKTKLPNGVTPDTADKQIKSLVITATYDKTTGKLELKKSEESDELTFANVYDTKAYITITGNKVLPERKLNEKEFTFNIKKDGVVVSSGKNNADGSITFAPALEITLDQMKKADGTYETSKIFEYEVEEVQEGLPTGVTGDTGKKTLRVKAEYSEATGQLQLTVADNSEEITFVNHYTTTGELDITGNKTLTGRDMKKNEFTFYIKDGQNKIVATGHNAANGTITFDEKIQISLEQMLNKDGTDYLETKDFVYTVVEAVEKDDLPEGVTAEEDVIRNLIVTAKYDKETGILSLTTSPDSEAINFVNHYDTQKSIPVTAKKTLTGRTQKDGEFTFYIKKGTETIATGTSAADGTITFDHDIVITLEDMLNQDGVTYAAQKEFTYTVEEDTTALPTGVTQGTALFNVIVTANYNEKTGELTLTSTADGKTLEFTNTYDTNATIPVEGAKTLTGRKMAAGEFLFEIKDESGKVVSNGTNKADGTITFTPDLKITLADMKDGKGGYAKDKDFYYTVTEKPGSDENGVDYDSSTKNITISAHYEETSGALTLAVKAGSDEVAFHNEYTTSKAVSLTGTKYLDGRDMKAGEFKFEVLDENGDVVLTGMNTAAGNIEFSGVLSYEVSDMEDGKGGYLEEKIFTYTVVEKNGSANGVTYDTTTVNTVNVKVTYNETSGELQAVRLEDDKPIAFNNKYDTSKAIGLTGTKTLDGRDLGDSVFTFEVKDATGKVVSTGTSNSSGEIVFDKEIVILLSDMAGTTPGTYVAERDFYYTVTEVKGSESGIGYDNTVKHLTLHADYNKTSGTISLAWAKSSEEIAFANTYTTKKDIALAGTKTLDGRDMKDKEFQFKVYDKAGNVVSEGTNNVNGIITFDKKIEISLSQMKNPDGTYADTREFEYTVKEVKGSALNTTYDSETKTLILVASYDKAAGTLSLAWKDDKGSVVFENSYTTEKTIGISGLKRLDGRDLQPGEFNFTWKDWNGKVVGTGTNDAAGNITFNGTAKITLADMADGNGGYAATKNFIYTVTEEKGDRPGVGYDTEAKTLTLTATYDKETGTLSLAWAKGSETFSVDNTYTTEKKISPNVNKKLIGRKLHDKEFTFKLKDAAGNLVATGTNDATGKVTFDKPISISLDKMKDGDGYASRREFTYTIEEVKGQAGNGVTYDENVRTITVVANYSKATGTLTLSLATDSTGVTFNNSYTTNDSVELTGVKHLDGRDMKNGEFKFEVRDAAGKVVLTGTNDAQGKITFDKLLSYKVSDMEDGEGGYADEKFFTYTVVELAGNAEGTTYDTTTIKTVKVKVTYNEDTGVLKAVLADDSEKVEFNNSYTTKDSVELEGTKALTGRAQTAGEFTFKVEDSEGVEVAAGTNDADGKITFDKELVITLADMATEEAGVYAEERDFTYTVYEVKGTTAAGITYDETVKTVIVHAEYDRTDGTLTLSLSEDSEAIVFENTYEASGSFRIGGNKLVNGTAITAEQLKVLAGKAEFTLSRADIDAEGNVGEYTAVQTVSLTAAGTFAFDTVNFDETDAGKAYMYKVTETKADAAGFGVDTTEYLYKVVVTDNGDGTLDVAITMDEKAVSNDITVTFDNTYTAVGDAEFTGTKSLLGDRADGIGAGEFTFAVLDAEGNRVATGTTTAAEAGEDASIVFDKITYTEADAGQTYTYTVKEVKGEDGNIVYDEATSYTVTVEVIDNYNGTLRTVVTYPEGFGSGVAFTNNYEADGEVDFEVNKNLEGRNAALGAGEFTFAVYEVIDGEEVAVLDAEGNPLTAVNGADGTVSFGTISYTQDDQGTHKYVIREVSGKDSTITYDPDPVEVTVTVTDENSDGTLTVTRVYEEDDTEFTNQYSADGSVTFTGTKKLLGNRKAQIGKDEFTFTVVDDATGETVATGTTEAGGTITFTKISYKQNEVGTHTYTVTEDAGKDGTIEYTGASFKVTVTVTDLGGGKLEAVATYPEGGMVFNNQYRAEDSLPIDFVTKALDGRDQTEGEFEFVLKDAEGNVLQTVTNGADGSIDFADLEYTEADINKEYTYTITETNKGAENVGYDGTIYTLTVKVEDSEDSDGTLKITPTITANGENFTSITFENTYTTDESIAIEGTKELTGRAQTAGEFTFKVEDSEGVEVAAGTNDADGKITFDKELVITLADMATEEAGVYAEERDFTYTVYEVKGTTAAGITYDETVKTVIVHAEYDRTDGTLTLSLSEDSEAIVFENTYEASGSFRIGGNKLVNGTAITAEQLKVLAGKAEFTLSRADIDAEGNVGEYTAVQTVSLTAAGTFAFDTVNFDETDAGKAYMYKVTETKADAAGFGVDTTEYLYKVVVTDNGDGTLDVAITMDEKAVSNDITVTFDNTYTAVGDAEFTGTKSLLGDRADGIGAGEFTFAVLDAEGNRVATGTTTAAEAGEDASIVFDKITYTEADAGQTYTYTVKEVKGEDGNIVYDEATSYTVTVEVIDNYNGTLRTVVTYPEGFGSGVAFTNNYEADGEVDFEVNKNLEGRNAALGAGEFTFAVYEVIDGEEVAVLDAEGNPLTAVNGADGTVSFGTISYTQDDQGTHKYVIREVSGKDSTITYDPDPVEVTVTVTDENSDGTLTVTRVYEEDDTEFTNQYSADGSVTFTGTKKLLGNRKAQIGKDEFTFTVVDDATGETVATGTTEAGGTITFTKISYKQNEVGTHTYTVTEDAGKDGTIEYTGASFKVTVTVTDLGGGKLEAVATYPEGGMVFNNQYRAEDSLPIDFVTKALDGRDQTEGEFEFVLKDAEGNVLQTVTNGADGSIDFADLEYTEADINKEYTYTITETNKGAENVGYDGTIYTLTVKVEDSEDSDGTLKITPTITANGENFTSITFENTYTTDESIAIEGTKELTGRAQTAGEFTFKVEDSEGVEVAAGTNDADGKITFDKELVITLDDMATEEAGVYAEERDFTYTVYEVKGTTAAGITYDETVKTVIVHAEYDRTDGTLTLSLSEDSEAIVFENTYEASGSFRIGGNKLVNGTAITAEQLKVLAGKAEFTLSRADIDAEGNVGEYTAVQTVSLTAAGTFAFDTVNFDETDAGKAYMYKVTETKADAAGFGVDTTEYLYKVVVTDNGDGTLDVAITMDEKAVSNDITVTFDNTYTAVGDAEFTGTKSLLGDRADGIGAGEFTFAVLDAEGNRVATGTTTAAEAGEDASIVFDKITYTEADAGQTYTYTVKEVKGEDGNIVYDEATSYTVTVEVIDNYNGTLRTVVTYPEGFGSGVAFTNNYEADGEVDFEVNKNLEGRNAALGAGEFTFAVYEVIDGEEVAVLDAEGNPLTAVNGADGTVSFGTISYTQDDQGTHKYVIREVSGKDSTITYDPDPVEVTVTVTDENSDGTLTVTRVYEEDDTEFTNQYSADGSVTFTGTKKLLGNRKAQIGKDEFTFTVVDDATGETVATGTTEAGGTITFTKISYKQNEVGTHTYTVTEDAGKDGTIEYTGASFKVTVTVTDLGGGKLEAVATYPEGGMVFNNQYRAEDSLPIDFVTKALDGRDQTEGEFEFVLKDAEGNVLQTVTNGADGSIDFADLEYTEADINKEYTYTITETNKGAENVGYDGTIYTLTVKVEDSEDSDGTLKITPTITANGENFTSITFENTYTTDESIAIEGTKALTGRAQTAGEFTFKVEDSEGVEVAAGTNDADGKITFDKELVITLADMATEEAGVYAEERDFTYTVYEVKGTTAAGITYDETVKTVIVHAEYDRTDGTLTLSLSEDSEAIVFENTYEASGSFRIGGNKLVNGTAISEEQLKVLAGKAEFTLSRADIDAEGNVGEYNAVQTVSLTAAGTFAFDTVNFDETDAGKAYMYKVTETKADAAGFGVDTTEYLYKVVVTDNGDSTLNVAITDSEDKEVADSITVTFDNTYTAVGSAAFTGTKTLLGDRADGIGEGEFDFVVLDEAGNKAATGTTTAAEAGKDASILFTEILYTEKNIGQTYTYTVKEVKGEDGTIIYGDKTIYTVTVSVTDNYDGTLTAAITYPEGFENGVEFTNNYEAAGSVVLEADKTLTGRTQILGAGEFTFAVYEIMEDGSEVQVLDADGNPLTAVNAEADEDGNGHITFGEIAYTQDDQGVHNYEIREIAGNNSAVVYDPKPVKVAVTVIDENSDGELTVTPVYAEDDHTAFVNEYHANGKVAFEASKKLLGNRGQQVKAGEFTFTVTDDDNENAVVAAGTTEDGGYIRFTEIEYNESQKGEHHYTITEDAGENTSIEYIAEPIKVTVNVTDNNDGTLEAVVTDYPEEGAVFTNQYRANGELVIDNIQKILNGSPLAEDQFRFELKDAEGNVLQTVSNDAEGKVTFEALKYTEEDIHKEYTYTVSEIKTDITGITYDGSIYTVIVKVEDSEESDGTLKLTVDTVKDEETVETMTFENRFEGTVALSKKGADDRILPGAVFALYAKNAEDEGYSLYTADSENGTYTTDEKGMIHVTGLPANEYYFLETEAPKGYVVNEEEFHFIIGVMDGEAGVVENAQVDAEVSVVNEVGETAEITVTKRTTFLDNLFDMQDIVMKDATFYVNLFVDPEGTIPYRNAAPKALHLVNTNTGTVTFEGIAQGIYYVFETDAEGNAIPYDTAMSNADGSRYVCRVESGSSQVELDLEADKMDGYVNLNNCYTIMPGGASIRAWLNISKTVLKGEKEVKVDDTFYAGIFTKDEAGNYELYTLIELVQGGEVEVEVGLGGDKGMDPVTYYVYETDADGKIVDPEEFAYEVKGAGEATVSREHDRVTVDLVNVIREKEATPTPTPTITPAPGAPTSKKPVKTGDDTPIALYLMLLLAATGVIGGATWKRRKAKK